MLTNLVLAVTGALLTPGAGPTGPDTTRYTGSGLWYSVTGSGSPVVLVHGANLDSRSWASLAAELATSHRVVLTDLRSHGRSRDADGPFSFRDDLLEVLDAAGAEHVTLIGHSLGAQIAIDLALARPDRIERLVLIGPAIGGLPLTKPPAGFEDLVAALQRGDLPGAGAVLAGMPVMTLFRDTVRQRDVRAMVTENARLFRADRAWVRQPERPAFARLGELTMPMLVLLGSADPTESNDAGRELLARVPGSVGETFAGCGHLVPIDCASEAVRAVAAFLRRAPPRG